MAQRIEDVVTGRHPGTQQAQHWFVFEHLSPELQVVARPCHDLAVRMIQTLNDGPELVAGLRKLREAKDCFVTQKIIDSDK